MSQGDDDFNDERTVVGDRSLLDRAAPVAKAREACLTVIAGPNVGEMFRVADGGDIGRSMDARFRLTDTEMSRRHARIVAREGRFFVEDLGSTNGTFVNGNRVKLQSLNDGDKLQVGTQTILRFSYQDDLDEEFQRRMVESALRDGLTKAYNKKYFSERLASELAYAQRHDVPISLLLLDLDHFKQVNDTYGHLAGDAVLVTFANLVFETIRKEDVFARYGGEEFAVISRGIDALGGRAFGERLRGLVEQQLFEFQGTRIPVTVSIGVATYPDVPATDPDMLVESADRALYESKAGGRNRVSVHEPATW